MSLVTDEEVKVQPLQYIMRPQEHLIADDQHRVDGGLGKLLEEIKDGAR